MINKGVNFDNIFDKFAVRIIVNSPIETEKADCWKIYSIVTDFYKPNPDRLRDWISTSKVNYLFPSPRYRAIKIRVFCARKVENYTIGGTCPEAPSSP